MSTEIWDKRILKGTQGQARRFSFFNPAGCGLGAWLEFVAITESGNHVAGGGPVKELIFRSERGGGCLWISDAEGRVRHPFAQGAWFYGTLKRGGQECLVRMRFIDEASTGPELGTRVYTQWQPGEWKQFPAADADGRLLHSDPRFHFGWGVTGNAYRWEPKPVEAEQASEAKRIPKSFAPAPETDSIAQESPTETPAVKKPKIFIPKNKQADTPTS
jgi:hypothetical protein